ncbi:MAG: hypothetical protein LBV69_04385 [Bacteroidales bacterium]|jgi:hypothetical protein|nr:hypothetical protein [Bacteroidales bacterium]
MLDKSVTINGINIYQEYGVLLLTNSYNSLFSYPKMKSSFFENDWHEISGSEIDFDTLFYASKEISLNFYCKNFENYMNFLNYFTINNGTILKIWNFGNINYSLNLRFLNVINCTKMRDIYVFGIKFSQDNNFIPDNFNISALEATNTPEQFEIDGYNIALLNLKWLDKSINNFLSIYDLKENYNDNLNYNNGQVYKGNILSTKSKDVQINLELKCINIDWFFLQYYNIFAVLMQKKEHILSINELGQDFSFIYKSMNIKSISFIHFIMIFELTVQVIDGGLLTKSDNYIALQDLSSFISMQNQTYIDNNL